MVVVIDWFGKRSRVAWSCRERYGNEGCVADEQDRTMAPSERLVVGREREYECEKEGHGDVRGTDGG